MEEDQYEDDTAAIHAAIVRVLEKAIIGASVLGALSLLFWSVGWL